MSILGIDLKKDDFACLYDTFLSVEAFPISTWHGLFKNLQDSLGLDFGLDLLTVLVFVDMTLDLIACRGRNKVLLPCLMVNFL